MIEREKQRTDQQKKHRAEKQRRAQSGKKGKEGTGQRQAGRATDFESMQDKGYRERIEEKTEKH